jgi:hypothetical protein
VLASSLGASNAVGYVDKRAVDDGVDVGDSYLTGRQIDIQCAVFGSTLADFHSKLQVISDIMRPNPRYYDSAVGFRELKFSQATIDVSNYSTGYAELKCIIRPMGLPNVVYSQASSVENSVSSASRGFSATVNLSFMAREPYKYRQDQRSISVSVATVSASPTTTALPNIGTAGTWPVIELIHPGTSTASAVIASVTFVVDSRSVKLNNVVFDAKIVASGVTADSTRWFIDFNEHAIYKGVRATTTGTFVQSLRMDIIDLTLFQFGSIPPLDDGASVLVTEYTGLVRPDTIFCKYYEAYY